MAAWLDYLNGYAAPKPKAPTFRPTSFSYARPPSNDYDPFAVSRTSRPLFAGSGGSSGSASPTGPTGAAAPERFDFAVPYTASPTSPTPNPIVQPTTNDVFGSIQGAFGDAMGNINLANAIPWFMERVHEASHGLAEAHKNDPIGAIGGAADKGTGFFLDTVTAASDVIAPVIDALPNWYRDWQLGDRAKLYQAAITGKEADYGFLGPSGSFIPGTYAVNERYRNYQAFLGVLNHSTDPNQKADAATQVAMIRDSIDLPESVKAAIRGNPNASPEQLSKMLDEAPEGRQWSYDPGWSGNLARIGNPLGFYAAEAIATRGVGEGVGSILVGGGVRTAVTATEFGVDATKATSIAQSGLNLALRSRGLGTAATALERGVQGAKFAGTMAMKLQKAAFISGVALTPLTIAMDAVARYQGDDAAIAWWSRVNEGGSFASNPNVQLVTGFAVNPLEGLKYLKKGTIILGHGVGKIALGKTLGTRMAKFYDNDALVYGQLAKMYRLSGPEEAKAFAPEWYANKGEVFDEVVGQAAKYVVNQLPAEERLALVAAHADGVKLTEAVLSTYAPQIVDALEKHSDELAKVWYADHWAYADLPGGFNPDVAGAKARDYRVTVGKSYLFRSRVDAVVGTQDFLLPQAQAEARLWLEQTAKDGVVPVEGRAGLQDLVRRFPAMRKYWQGLVKPGESTVSKEAVEEMIAKGERDYRFTQKVNPVKARTGADPVLRKDSPRLKVDYADSLGTSVATVDAIAEFKMEAPDAAGVSLLRQFITEKLGIDPEVAAGMKPEEVWQKAADYAEDTTRPWLEAGDRLAAAEKHVAALRSRLRDLETTEPGRRTSAHTSEIARVQKDLDRYAALISDAGDPIRPFADEVGSARIRARTADKVRQMDPDHLTPDNESFLRRYVYESEWTPADSLAGRELWEKAKEIADAAPVSTGQDAHLLARANRKVAAIGALRELAAIDDQAAALGLTSVATEDWSSLVRKVQGNWTWTGGKPAMSPGLRRAASEIFARQGKPYLASEIMLMGDEAAWSSIVHDHPEVLEQLSRTQRNYVTRQVEQGAGSINVDEYAQSAIDSGMATRTEDFLERVYALANQREEMLSAHGIENALDMRNVVRQASMDVPATYEAEAQAIQNALVFDAQYAAEGHPFNLQQAKAILDNPGELYPGLRGVVLSDPILLEKAQAVAREHGVSVEHVVTDQAYATELRNKLIPPDFEAPEPGIRVETELDDLVMQGDTQAVADRSAELLAAADGPHDPIRTTVSAARRARPVRASNEWRGRLAQYGADLHTAPDAGVLADPANRVGLDVLSLLNHGITGTKPATLRGTIELLGTIERGNGGRMGLGASLQSEAQRVANEILRKAVADAKRAPFEPGTFAGGLDPAAFAMDDWTLARQLPVTEAQENLMRSIGRGEGMNIVDAQRTLAGTLDNDTIRAGREAESRAANLAVAEARGGTAESGGAMRAELRRSVDITYEPRDPLGTLQYGFKKRPASAVVLELSQVPGLSEEFVTSRFQPWQERVWNARVRQGYNYVFGPHSNTQVRAEVKTRFMDRLAAKGIEGSLADKIWQRWQKEADVSREPELRVEGGKRKFYPGDNPLYAGIGNIPNMRMDQWAHEVLDEVLLPRNDVPAYLSMAHEINYADVFREASSFTRRSLKDLPAKAGAQTLGDGLSQAYGHVFHNKVATTMYYWFRFGLDIRYHAMNYFEAQLLHLGRAGFKHGELDTGLLGNTEGYLRRLDTDFMDNTGYATSRSRFAWAYRTFLKEQPDALRGAIKGLEAEDPRLMDQAVRELATADPTIRNMIADMGDTPDGWLKGINEWHGKMLKAATENADGDLVIDELIAREIEATPAMAEVYGQLAKVNKELWGDIRDTFYGNANRSRAERFLNSYLLFWPLSYQIKSAKWLMKVLYDRAGGLQTNGAGAVILSRVAASHQQLLATDPSYRDWYEKHPTLVFAAQMLLPITPDSMGVSLSPGLRSLFFGRSKAIWDVGPIYTVNHIIRPGAQELGADLSPAFRDVPGLDGAYRALTGQEPPKPTSP